MCGTNCLLISILPSFFFPFVTLPSLSLHKVFLVLWVAHLPLSFPFPSHSFHSPSSPFSLCFEKAVKYEWWERLLLLIKSHTFLKLSRLRQRKRTKFKKSLIQVSLTVNSEAIKLGLFMAVWRRVRCLTWSVRHSLLRWLISDQWRMESY